MKKKTTVMCYGDSNTYGYNPTNGMRYPSNVRWTGRLQMLLGDNYQVIEEGCNGRTTIYDDPWEGWKNGRDYLKPCLNSHKPLDIVILMLGSNDLKSVFRASARDCAYGAELLVSDIQEFCREKQGFEPIVILVSPPEVSEAILADGFGGAFDGTAITRSKEFSPLYREVAEKYHCIFADAATYVTASDIDGLHLMPEEHEKLAKGLADIVLNSTEER